MQNKLQELTDKLYDEGLSKGRQEGEALLARAQEDASRIVEEAKSEAARIIAEAERNATELRTKAEADVKMSASQSLTAIRQDMERLVLAKIVEGQVNATLADADFVKELIRTVVAAFNPANAEPVSLDVIVPEQLRSQVEPFVTQELGRQFGAEVRIDSSKKLAGGFAIAPHNGGFMLKFTDEEFRELISSYLRPATRKLLFG